MIKKEKLEEISKKLTINKDDFTKAFRYNLGLYIKDNDISLSDISNDADIPWNTLNSFLYGKSNNVRIDNVVKLSKALRVSIDELVGADTIPELSIESLRMCRELPDNDLYLVRWFIRYLYNLNSQSEPNKRYVSVMDVECNYNGNLKITNRYKKVDITYIDPEIKGKVFLGVTMPCDHYMPVYSPYDILLIANDRSPKIFENCLILINGILHIARRKSENGIVKYYSIRDGKYRVHEKDIDELIGYVAYTIQV